MVRRRFQLGEREREREKKSRSELLQEKIKEDRREG